MILASVPKSLLSALIGIAVERGELSLSWQIGELGIDDNEPSLTPNPIWARDTAPGYGYVWWTGFRDNYTGAFGETLAARPLLCNGLRRPICVCAASLRHGRCTSHRPPPGSAREQYSEASANRPALRLILDAAPPPDRL
jgi:hypothetical protein